MKDERKVKQPVSQFKQPADYSMLLESLKTKIMKARQKASLAANALLIHLYWEMGRDILHRQESEGWGS